MRTIALAITGASGAQYGLRLLQTLLAADCRVALLLSRPGQLVIDMETDEKLPARTADMRRALLQRHGIEDPDRLAVYGREEWTAPVASGSGAPDAMVVCPCSMGTLSSLAVGASRSLIERAGDVMLKERRKLILVPRETPLSEIHLKNMLTLTRAGAVMLPANPGFYHRPERVEELVDFVVARVLDQLGIDQTLMPRWGRD